jgi:DNA-directed RNA polymerase subunit RPC12/RpoP
VRGSIARRVQCVHCKSTTEQVLTTTVVCSHCQRRLMVRDHYSHRLNAFMGVSMDAEDVAT